MNFDFFQLRKCQNNDPQSQRELYELFKDKVMGICRRYTKDKSEGKDVFQESFIKIFGNIGKLKSADHLEIWIRKITINTAINHYHMNKKHEHADEKYGFNYKDGEDEIILSNITDVMLVRLVNSLPDGYRMVFNLSAIEGYSHAEISQLLGISESTSRSQLNRARKVLKNKLHSLGISKYERYA